MAISFLIVPNCLFMYCLLVCLFQYASPLWVMCRSCASQSWKIGLFGFGLHGIYLQKYTITTFQGHIQGERNGITQLRFQCVRKCCVGCNIRLAFIQVSSLISKLSTLRPHFYFMKWECAYLTMCRKSSLTWSFGRIYVKTMCQLLKDNICSAIIMLNTQNKC